MNEALVLAPTAEPNVFLASDGTKLRPPPGWACLPPGDAGLTRRVKQLGPSWAVIEKRGRKAFSKGLWAPSEHIEAAKNGLAAERSTPQYAKKQASAVARRSISNSPGTQETGFQLQLELNGLASVGTDANAFLERSIRGYSPETSRR